MKSCVNRCWRYLCHLRATELAALTRSMDAMAAEGLRVLGVARASFAGQTWPDSQHDFAFEFLGLVGLADPMRSSVPEAVSDCRSAGIKVVMITGDYPATARAIVRQAGLDAEDVVTGEELEKLGDTELARRVKTVTVFARIMPEQKLRIVSALKANGEIVAMTGDGVNDAASGTASVASETTQPYPPRRPSTGQPKRNGFTAKTDFQRPDLSSFRVCHCRSAGGYGPGDQPTSPMLFEITECHKIDPKRLFTLHLRKR